MRVRATLVVPLYRAMLEQSETLISWIASMLIKFTNTQYLSGFLGPVIACTASRMICTEMPLLLLMLTFTLSSLLDRISGTVMMTNDNEINSLCF